MTVLRCHGPGRRGGLHCRSWLGESPTPLRFLVTAERWGDAERVRFGTSDVRRCPRCGLVNVFQPANSAQQVACA